MSNTLEELKKRAAQLSDSERVELALSLIESLDVTLPRIISGTGVGSYS